MAEGYSNHKIETSNTNTINNGLANVNKKVLKKINIYEIDILNSDDKNVLKNKQLKLFYMSKRDKILNALKNKDKIDDFSDKNILLDKKEIICKISSYNTNSSNNIIEFIKQCNNDFTRTIFYNSLKNHFFDVKHYYEQLNYNDCLKFINEKIFNSIFNQQNIIDNYNITDEVLHNNSNNTLFGNLNIDDKFKKLFFNMNSMQQGHTADFISKLNLIMFEGQQLINFKQIYGENTNISVKNHKIIYFDHENNLILYIGYLNLYKTDPIQFFNIGKYIRFIELDKFEDSYSYYVFELDIDFPEINNFKNINSAFNNYFQNISNISYNINVMKCLCSPLSGSPLRIKPKSRIKEAKKKSHIIELKQTTCADEYKHSYPQKSDDCNYKHNLLFRPVLEPLQYQPCNVINPKGIFNLLFRLYYFDFKNTATSIILITDIKTIEKLLPIFSSGNKLKQYDIIEIEYEKMEMDNKFTISLFSFIKIKEDEDKYEYIKKTIDCNLGGNVDETIEILTTFPKKEYHRIYFFCTDNVDVQDADPSLSIDEFKTFTQVLTLFPEKIKLSLPIFFTSYLFKHQLIASLLNYSLKNIRDAIRLDESKTLNIDNLSKILINIFIIRNDNFLDEMEIISFLRLLRSRSLENLELDKLISEDTLRNRDSQSIINLVNILKVAINYKNIKFLVPPSQIAVGGSNKKTKTKYANTKFKNTKCNKLKEQAKVLRNTKKKHIKF